MGTVHVRTVALSSIVLLSVPDHIVRQSPDHRYGPCSTGVEQSLWVRLKTLVRRSTPHPTTLPLVLPGLSFGPVRSSFLFL